MVLLDFPFAKANEERTVHLVDVNTRAIQLAEKNAAANGIQNVRIYESDGLSAVNTANFAAIITNPPIRAGKETYFSFLRGIFREVGFNGRIVGCDSKETRGTINF